MKKTCTWLAVAAGWAVAGCSSPMRNQPAPDFNLQSVGGGRVQLSALRGKPVVVSFWGST